MNIAVLTSLFPSSERPYEGIFVLQRWRRMLDRGHRVRVVQPLPWAGLAFGKPEWAKIRAMPRHEQRDGLQVERPRYLHLPGRSRANARAFARRGLATIARGAAVEVVVADYAWPAAAAAPGCAQRGWPLVISGRGSDVLQVAEIPALRRELAQALRTAGHWCGVSEHLVAAMDELAGRPGHGVLVANGVDGELFRPGDRGDCRRQLGIDPEASVVLVVGHLIERKDPLRALECFRRHREAHPADSLRLDFIGSGPLQAPLQRAIREHGLESCVHLQGEVPPQRLAVWYAAADALLLTSSREGRPNVVLEALASGLRVLATDVGGTGELLAGNDRMLAPSRDPGELASGLQRLLDTAPDPARCRALAERWSWDAGLDALEALLERAASGH